MKIGVFDSGVGGLSFVRAIEQAMPDADVIFRNDHNHVPYGSRPKDEILHLVIPIFDELVREDCKVIVVACNTVSTTLISTLRERYTIPLIAVEPMVKSASKLTKTGVIAVCATPTTLASDRYHWLKQTYASGITVLEPDCSNWSSMIENNEMSETELTRSILKVLDQQADVIVLGCTHYHWIEDEINLITKDRAIVIQPEQPVIKQLKRVLSQLA